MGFWRARGRKGYVTKERSVQAFLPSSNSRRSFLGIPSLVFSGIYETLEKADSSRKSVMESFPGRQDQLTLTKREREKKKKNLE